MPSVSVVELTNTFDDWRNRTNDVISEINGANSVDPTSAIVYANSTSGFQVNEVVSDAITGTAITGTRLIFTGGNINFTSANTSSLGNVHQTHILGGTSIDVSTPDNADTSISNTFIYNSKINLNGQKFISGEANIDFEGATISNDEFNPIYEVYPEWAYFSKDCNFTLNDRIKLSEVVREKYSQNNFLNQWLKILKI